MNKLETGKVTPTEIYASRIIQHLGYNPYSFKTETLGQKLRPYRPVHGYTLQNLGEILGFSEQTIVSWESDKRKPGKGCLKKIDTLIK